MDGHDRESDVARSAAGLFPNRISRRGMLVGGAALVGAAAAGGALAFAGAAGALVGDEYDELRARWADIVTGGAIDPGDPAYAEVLARLNSGAQQTRATFDTSSGRTALWPDAPVGSAYPSANLSTCHDRLWTLTVCWATPGGVYHGEAALVADILAGLRFLRDKVYHPGQATWDNWHTWEIAVPQRLMDMCVLLHDRIDPAQLTSHLAAIDYFVPTPYKRLSGTATTGSNRVNVARVVALRGILGKVAAKIATARDSLSEALAYVLVDDGLYRDGSFVQHDTVAYTGTYGVLYFDELAKLFELLAGSSWEVTNPAKANIYDAVSASLAPVVYRGIMTDTVRGRAIARSSEPDVADGLSAALAVLRLAGTAPVEQAARFRSLAKGWMLANTLRPVSTYGRVSGVVLARAVLDDQSIPAAAEPVGHSLLPDMDRAVHRRPGWAYSLSLSSARIARFEEANGENLHGWHTGDGMGLLHLDSDPAQYNDAFWPTVDPYRLPGTTVDTVRLADAAGERTETAATWVGGAVLDGEYAAVGMDLRAHGVTLVAKKSWFCLDGCIVALGAGITSSDGRPIETIIDNRNLHDPASAASTTLTVDGAAQPEALGTPLTFTGARWAHLAGVGGYLFPGGVTLRALREDRTGSWRQINAGGSTSSITRRYLTIWLNHGASPSGAGYAYLLLPGASAAATAAQSANPAVQILANTASVQAVAHAGLGITAANFYAAGSAGGISVDAPCSVVMRESEGELTLAVADPSRKAKTVTVFVARAGYVSATPGPGVTVISAGPSRIIVLAEVGGAHGGTRRVTLSTSGTPLAAASVSLLAPVADATVRDGTYAATNYGSEATLVVKRTDTAGNGYNRIAYLRFDLSGLTRRVERAVLWVHGATADSAGIHTGLRAWPVTNDAWTESGVTWNTRPTLVGAALGTEGMVSTRGDWIGLSVTAHVAAAAPAAGGDGRASLGIWQSTVPGLAVVLNSRQNATNPPRLQVVTR